MAGHGGFDDDPARMILRQRGYEFCDDRSKPIPGPSSEQEAILRESQDCLEDLVSEGLFASSTDHERQSIDETLADDMAFWSSVGSTFRDATESLTYRLKYPVCLVHTVQVSVYRATYQFGQPIYPPGKVAVDVGPSPEKLHRVSEAVPINAHTEPQIIPLSKPLVAIGGYLRIWMEGKPQMQLADGRHYIAIRHVSALGLPVPDSVVSRIPRAMACMDAMLLPTGSHFQSVGLSCVTPSTKPTVRQMIKQRCENYQRMKEAAQEGSTKGNRDESVGFRLQRMGSGRFSWWPIHNWTTSRSQTGTPATSDSQTQTIGLHPPKLNVPDSIFHEAEPVDWPVFEFPEQLCNFAVETDACMSDKSQ
ncbi:hypothetical protein BSKO_08249 [Bryopsis sp. KO-2023]|nr:hypothetical protein BSKO_08249 [Bryopsis sp. KO-2023]